MLECWKNGMLADYDLLMKLEEFCFNPERSRKSTLSEVEGYNFKCFTNSLVLVF